MSPTPIRGPLIPLQVGGLALADIVTVRPAGGRLGAGGTFGMEALDVGWGGSVT